MTLKKKLLFTGVTLAALVFLLFEFKLIPKKINLNKFSTGSARLTWNANTEADLAGYKIYYGTAPRTSDCPPRLSPRFGEAGGEAGPPGGYEKNIDAGKDSSYTLNDLEIGKTYYFSVTSYNFARKESCFSGEMKKTISHPAWEKLMEIFRR